jgi:hypothetical protein
VSTETHLWVLEDEVLGRLERDGGMFVATRTPRRAKPYRLTWEPRDATRPTESIEVLRGYVTWFDKERRAVHAHTCTKLWERWQLWRDSRDRRDQRTTFVGFSRRIRLHSLNIAFDGPDLAVYALYDDNLFGRHTILVGLLDRNPYEPELSG